MFDPEKRHRSWQVAILATSAVAGFALLFARELPGGEAGTTLVATTPLPPESDGASSAQPDGSSTAPTPLQPSASVTPATPLTPLGQQGSGSRPGGESLAPGASDLAQDAQGIATATSFRVATINTLGDSHTRPGGNKPKYASGPDRTRTLLGIMTSQGLHVAGLQEFERPQKATFNNIAPAWDVFTGTERGRDSIAYRNDVWDYVTGGTGTIPYFRGNPAPMPWVTLRHQATGREVSFISIHNPTSNPRRGNNAGHRAEATRREIAMVRALADGGNPVMLLGDFNERAEAFCMVTSGGDIGAANGGSVGGGCAPPPNMGIDWIFGTTDIAFSNYLRHQDATVNRTTDHPVIVANATITEPLP